THTLLWFWLGDSRLSAAAHALIVDPQNENFMSPASPWEIAIKISLGKYTLQQPFETFFTHALARTGIRDLPIDIKHVAALTNLPFHHRDPFDRLIVAQAMMEQMPIVSVDPLLDPYSIRRLW